MHLFIFYVSPHQLFTHVCMNYKVKTGANGGYSPGEEVALTIYLSFDGLVSLPENKGIDRW